MDTPNLISIRGQKYKVEVVSKIYFRGLTECLRDLGDVDLLSKSAKAIKKVIIPSIPEDVITKGDGDEEFYLWHPSVEPEEINDIILNCARCYRLQKLSEARSKGDKNAIAEHEEGLAIINKYLEPEGLIEVEVTEVDESQVHFEKQNLLEQELENLTVPSFPARKPAKPSTQSEIDELKARITEMENQK